MRRLIPVLLLFLIIGGCQQKRPDSETPPPVKTPAIDTVRISLYQPEKPPKLLESFCVFSVATLNGESLKVADTLCILCGAIDTLACPNKLFVKLGKDTLYDLKLVSKSPSDIFCQACSAKKKTYQTFNAPQPL